MPRTLLFGTLRQDSMIHAVQAVGSMGEIFQRHFEEMDFPASESTGLNRLNDQNGPQLYALPGL